MKNIVKKYLSSKNKKIVVSDSNETLTDENFKKKVYYYKNQIKSLLTKGDIKGVAIDLDRSCDYICVIFACWLSNCFYLPLSNYLSSHNKSYQIKKSCVSIIVTKKNNVVKFIKLKNISNNKLINQNNGKISYIIFTSGSTGQKKGVIISNSNLKNYYTSIKNAFNKKYYPKSLLINGELIFDISLADLIFAFVFNCEISITSDPRNLLSLIYMMEKKKIESIYVVPSTLEKLVYYYESKKQKINFVKQLNCGGEELTKSLVNKAFKTFPKAKIYNFYGPTECTINVTFFEITKKLLNSNNEKIPIGKPLYSVKSIISKNDNELIIGGGQVMLGYVNENYKFKIYKNQKYYLTGDIVSLDVKQNLYFSARKKNYIKHKGYRINLDSIERTIRNKTRKECKIILNNNKVIIFFLKKTKKSILKNLDKILDTNLEHYEKPDKIVYVNKFEYNSSGKVDAKNLSKLIS